MKIINITILLSIVIAAVSASVLAAGNGSGMGKQKSASPGITVVTQTVDQHTISQSLSLIGKLASRESVIISSEVSGKVESILVSENQKVKAGELLLQLESDKVTAALAEAQAYLNDEQRKLKEYSRLAKRGAITSTEVDAQQTSVDIARARLQAQQANLKDLNIRAPFSGTIGLIDFSLGKMVSSGESLMTLDNLSIMQLDLNVPERYLSMLAKGMQVSATSSAWQDMTFQGALVSIDSRVNSETLNLRVRVEFPNPDVRLKPGMMLQATVGFPPLSAPIIPAQALEYSGTKRFVYVVDEHDKAKRTQVYLGSRIGNNVVIEKGVNIGDRIVVQGTVNMRDGVRVTESEPAAQHQRSDTTQGAE
ncbi:efflux transporter periplasmic adaptor subunit [Vibrio albus]|uniref:Efflux transporter periplasmic adaptor subunit n=1 Tax=Vibrio albus TaxID=2200953 RepID=A0A2U3BBT8_9VIBR|nr:efflux RND transporter periplasmic adaptor subunit [Vibrio albus]PWI34247.1 efflux transporter periplasmic adaptor subunit [Vibrio albus]